MTSAFALREIIDECTTAISLVATAPHYWICKNPGFEVDDIPNGFRNTAHIKFSMIRETAREEIKRLNSKTFEVTL